MNDDQRAFIRRLVAEVLDGLLNAPESDALDPRLSIAGGGTVTVSVLRVGSEDGHRVSCGVDTAAVLERGENSIVLGTRVAREILEAARKSD